MENTRKKCSISVNSALGLLGVSTSGLYAYKNQKTSNRSIRKHKIKKEIAEIYNESKQIYGAPKITEPLKLKGYKIAEKNGGH